MKLNSIIPTIEEKPMVTKLVITTAASVVITLIAATIYACLKTAKEADKIIEEEFEKRKHNDDAGI